ncbi:hypothetical protein F4779DRAFT_217248 [Xylariaceae sp. FL0662B]|nr:hypothetical protein F4779DRAFT_217248 [Xylariaceae sp. FL0662B]
MEDEYPTLFKDFLTRYTLYTYYIYMHLYIPKNWRDLEVCMRSNNIPLFLISSENSLRNACWTMHLSTFLGPLTGLILIGLINAAAVPSTPTINGEPSKTGPVEPRWWSTMTPNHATWILCLHNEGLQGSRNYFTAKLDCARWYGNTWKSMDFEYEARYPGGGFPENDDVDQAMKMKTHH